jgi:hypothetical protein
MAARGGGAGPPCSFGFGPVFRLSAQSTATEATSECYFLAAKRMARLFQPKTAISGRGGRV